MDVDVSGEDWPRDLGTEEDPHVYEYQEGESFVFLRIGSARIQMTPSQAEAVRTYYEET